MKSRNLRKLLPLLVLLSVAGCGGGNGSASLNPLPIPTPTPVLSPTPSPIPSPTPSPTPIVTSAVLNTASPNSVSAGEFSLITLTGTGFSDATIAELLNTSDLLTEVDSVTQMHAQLSPALAAATYSIAVRNGNAASNSLPFSIAPAMTLIPTAATWAPGSAHTLRAKIFGAPASALTWTATGGTVDSTGTVDTLSGFSFTTFTAPATPGSFQITATGGAFHASATIVVSATAGAFAASGVCNAHGQDFTVTELPTGNIAIVGGDTGNGVNEVYRPSTNTCSPMAISIHGRYQHSATVITAGANSGKLIACGGFLKNTSSELSDCELYDPGTDTWTQGPSMNLPRHNSGTAALANGDILFAGGRTDAKTEIYVAATSTFKAGCTLTAPRFLAGVARLPSGNVLIAGGATSDGVNTANAVNSAELYKAATNACVSVGKMLVARQAPNISVLPDGSALISGTAIQGAENPTIETFSESTLRFSVIGTKQLNTCCFSQSLLPNGKLLLSGGIWQQEITGQSEIFDPLTGNTTGTDVQKNPRFLQKALTTQSGSVIQIGGHGVTADPSTEEIYQP